jgi:hypothetical protein
MDSWPCCPWRHFRSVGSRFVGKQNRKRRDQKKQADRRAERRRNGGGRASEPLSGSHVGPGGSRPWGRSSAGEIIDSDVAVDDAVRLLLSGNVEQIEKAVKLLADGTAMSGGRAGVERALAKAMTSALRHVWMFGWQPADVVRVVGRRYTSSHRRLESIAIVTESAAYPAASTDPRWSAQVDTLVADLREGRQRPGRTDTSWVVSASPDRSVAVQTALECLLVVCRLPELPTLCPPPGRGTQRGRTVHTLDESLLRKVRALLAKAESTTFEEEAQAFTAKAQELMTRHSIDRIVLDQHHEASDEPVATRIGVDDPYAQAKAMLLALVAMANRCRAVWMKEFGFSTVFGHVDDLDGVDMLYTSLLVQATRVMTSMGSQQTMSGQSRTRSFRQSFLVGFAHRIGERLTEATRSAETAGVASHGASLLPVLADRQRAVDDAAAAAYPELSTFQPSVANSDGWMAGTAAADMAALWGAAEVGDEPVA